MSFKTADLLDDYSQECEVILGLPAFLSYGQRRAFCGKVRTLKVYEDNSLVRQLLGEDGNGAVLVVDGGGSNRCALLGDQLAVLAQKNHWAGLVIYGLIRDSDAINAMDIGVKALGTMPLKSVKKNAGSVDVDVAFCGARIQAGDYLYADADGIIIAKRDLLAS